MPINVKATCYMCAKSIANVPIGYGWRWVCGSSCQQAGIAMAVLEGLTVNRNPRVQGVSVLIARPRRALEDG